MIRAIAPAVVAAAIASPAWASDGSIYASYLNSLPSLGVHENDLMDRATDCAMPSLAGSAIECRASSATHLWGQGDYQHRSVDGDAQAGRSVSKRFTGLLGIDTRIGNAAFAGVDGGWLTNDLSDGGHARGKGWTIGAYADFDPGPLFVKGVTSYSALNGHSTRVPDGDSGAAFEGNPDARTWTAGLHGGVRFPLGGSSVLTPRLDLDYVHSGSSGFTERGGDAAALTVSGGHSNHLFATAGLNWARQLGGVVPEVELGYRFRFGSDRSRLTARFFDPDSPAFELVSAGEGKGEVLAGLSVGGKFGAVDLRIVYQAEFNGEVMSHAGNFRLVLPLGSHAEPPPLLPPPLPQPGSQS